MAFDYSDLSNVAVEQINQFGRDVTLKYVAAGTYSPATDAITGDSVTSVTVKAVVRDFNLRELDDTLIKAGDKRMMIAAAGITKPDINDKIVDGGLTYEIVRILEIKPGSSSLIYNLQVRR